jgi:hypothetical protein
MKTCNKSFKCHKHSKSRPEWDPLLLILPLRLGLNEFNEEYKNSIKVILKFLKTISYLFCFFSIAMF